MSRRERDSRKRSRSRSWTRSRSRSWSRSRSPSNRRSPSGRGVIGSPRSVEATSDPRTLDARIFVGSLKPEVTSEMLKKYFSKFGEVKGVHIYKKKFGFVQFATKDESNKCLENGPFAIVEGYTLNVKPAKIRRPGEDEEGGIAKGGGAVHHPQPPTVRRREFDETRSSDYYPQEYYRDSERSASRDAAVPHHSETRPGVSRVGYQEQYPDYYRDYYDRYYREGAAAPRDYEHSLYSSRAAPPDPVDPLDPNRPNDLEIVVPNKLQRQYAEMIEAQLRRLGLLVDILFPPSEVSSARVLADLTNRRCLYAVTVTQDNEKHRSLTLNILHGTPQEHRNMPVDDALPLVRRDFDSYVRQARRRIRDVVPRDIRILMFDLLESQSLSMGDLDKLIKYLKERQNYLVDEQIELKRETAGAYANTALLQSSSLASNRPSALASMAVTYPGYNYNVPSSASSSSISSAPVGINSASASIAKPLPASTMVTYPGFNTIAVAPVVSEQPIAAPPAPPPPTAVAVSAHLSASAVVATSVPNHPPPTHVQYPSAYGTMLGPVASVAAAGGIPTAPAPVLAAPPVIVSAPLTVAPPPAPGIIGAQKPVSDLQDRILSLMKSNAVAGPACITATAVSTMPPPVGVPPPVPAPTVVPPPALLHHTNPYGAAQGLPPQGLALKDDKTAMLAAATALQQVSPYHTAYQGWHQ